MVFSSIIFLFAFLPAVLAAYHGLRFLLAARAPGLWQPARLGVLLAFSLLFYGWGETRWIGIMLLSAGTDWLAGLAIARGPLAPGGPRTLWQRATLACALTINLGLLLYFKYWNRGGPLPLGISFYTFKSMSYSIDVYRARVVATANPLRYACFITLFPEMVAGPIVRYESVADQLAHDRLTLEGAALGVRRFVIGLAKKLLIANTLAVPVDALHAADATTLTAGAAWLAAIAYAGQIYFDFSGYSDMAIGLGLMFGFTFPENFRHPYAADSVKEFWRRWHISLSTWFRDYLYIPLGGDRCGRARTVFNLLAVFTLCGLWHGAHAAFVVWGLWHGLFLLIERTRVGAWLARAPAVARHAYVLLVVVVGWVPFRAHGLRNAGRLLLAMAGLAPGPALHPAEFYLTPPVLTALVAGAFLSFPQRPLPRLLRPVVLATLWCACVLSLAAGTHNPFIYYRF